MAKETDNSTTDDRPRGLLTEADREFLRGERKLSESAERNARQRIRDRVQTGMADFELLWSLLPDRDLELIFYPDDEDERQRIRSWSQQAMSFLILGLWTNRDPHADRVTDAIEQAAFAAGWLADAEVNLDTERAPEGDLLLAKMQHKNQRINDLRERIAQEDLGELSEQELKDELKQEAAFQYYLFEKGLMDSSVDAEKFSSMRVLGFETDMPPEDIEKSQQAWEETPLVRQKLPVFVDISYRTGESFSDQSENAEDNT